MLGINLFCSLLAVLVTLGPVRALGLPRWGVALVGVALVALAQQTLAHRAFGASMLSPDALPLPLVALFLWGTAFLLTAGGLTVVWLALRLCHVAVSGWWPLALGAAMGVFLVWMGERMPPVRERVAVLPGLPAEAEGLGDGDHGGVLRPVGQEEIQRARSTLHTFVGSHGPHPIAHQIPAHSHPHPHPHPERTGERGGWLAVHHQHPTNSDVAIVDTPNCLPIHSALPTSLGTHSSV